ncbi:hypothetical protein [Halotalea alkalilenta]|uniref:Nitrite/Sulfite reductase ferredoxin-like domain-containing protein n=1 Tax=Halotalea alkalilenta TaxID=376489 RepID=A0A172YCD0_9GAMM|nr:hypothetical protein [Halotalea alkalilenta]ANF56909.1 hypothetical protein A5892_05020 [Halotalea alkalilenta]
MNAIERRRFACPTLSAPMATGDGLLVRLSPLRDGLDGAAAAMLAEAARRYGSGEFELTRRGNLQVRGFDAPGALAFATAAKRLADQRSGPLPLALEPLCDDPLAGRLAALRDQLAARLAGFETPLAAKCSVLLERRGDWGFAGLAADLRLRLDGDRLSLGIDGDAALACWFSASGAPVLLCDAAMVVLERLAGAGRRARGVALRSDRTLAAQLEALGFRPSLAPASAPAVVPGSLRRGTLVVGCPFGALPSARFEALAALCLHHGLRCWPLPGRLMLLAGEALGGPGTDAIRDELAGLGMVLDQRDPRLRIEACRGRPGCASAGFDTRALAERLVQQLAVLDPAGRVELHLSGCPKGCARSRPAAVCLVGGEREGMLGVVLDGRADGLRQAWLNDDAECVAAALPALLARG